MLAPYYLPLLGIGSEQTRLQAEGLLHLHEAGPGTGLAGSVNGLLSSLPILGPTLAAGGIPPILISAAIGIGGVMLANWMEKRETPTATIRWSKVIRTASLATSALIALPSILTGLSFGLTHIALAFGDDGTIVNRLMTGIGVSGHATATSAISAVLPHLLLCTASLMPVGLAYWLGTSKGTPDNHITPGRGPDAHERLMPRSAAEIYSTI